MYIANEDMPYFMKNPDWFYFDEDEEIYKPTKAAPQKAKDSINRFNAEHTGADENGNQWTDF